VLAADDAVYITGKYENRYEFGSNPPADNTATFIARYDLEGNRIWFKEFLSESGDPRIQKPNAVMALQSDGNLIVALDSGLYPNHIFRLNADGEIEN
jgi:hypothetical protein